MNVKTFTLPIKPKDCDEYPPTAWEKQPGISDAMTIYTNESKIYPFSVPSSTVIQEVQENKGRASSCGANVESKVACDNVFESCV